MKFHHSSLVFEAALVCRPDAFLFAREKLRASGFAQCVLVGDEVCPASNPLRCLNGEDLQTDWGANLEVTIRRW